MIYYAFGRTCKVNAFTHLCLMAHPHTGVTQFITQKTLVFSGHTHTNTQTQTQTQTQSQTQTQTRVCEPVINLNVIAAVEQLHNG